MTPSRPILMIEKLAAAAFILVSCSLAYIKIGIPPVVIVGGSSIVGFTLWLKTYRHGPVPARVILPAFLLTVAGLEFHMIEEYFMQFGPAMSRLFDITWTQSSFVLIFTFVGPILYSLTALGLFLEIPIAGFIAWFIFIGPGVAEFTHFIFPLLTPAIDPSQVSPITHAFANGVTMADLPNFWIKATGQYYFPGLYTAIVPMIPGIYGIIKVLRWNHEAKSR